MIDLRTAQASDAPALGGILTDWRLETPWLPKLHSAKGNKRHMARMIAKADVTVAESEGRILGFLQAGATEIEKLYVGSAARNGGVGRRLLDEAKARMPRIGLWTFQANSGARRLYARHGFREDRLTKGAMNDERLPDVYLIGEGQTS